jgi:hypothetical protein
LFNIGQALSSFVVALIIGKGYAGLCLCYLPVVVGMFMFVSKVMAKVQTEKVIEMVALGGVT